MNELPTKVLFGRGCVLEHAHLLASLGKHALIVTGSSSKNNGALSDMVCALSMNGQHVTVFDRVTPNPKLGTVREGVALLKAASADFVIGIGGGSPMDAAKAVALLAVQPRRDGEVFLGNYAPKALPLALVPTTAGTGSEVTQYAILTNPEQETKTSISSPALFAKFAFLDGSYTDGLSVKNTVSPALDAFSHAVESLLTTGSTPESERYAEMALKLLAPLLGRTNGPLEKEERDRLLYASTVAGMAIAFTGTTAVHGMGYQLTYHCGIDHGRANALLLGETLRLCREKEIPALHTIEQAFGRDVEEICALLDALLGEREPIPREELVEFARRSEGNKNIKKSAYAPTPEEIRRIFLHSFGA